MDGTQSNAMRDFYARVDAAIAALNLRCNACGECCHFDKVDHILYASTLERKFLRENAPLPTAPAAVQRCPCQSPDDNRCRAGNARTLGCRIHFCAWNDTPEESDFAEKWHSELQRLHEELNEPWDYRPLLPL